MYVRVIHAFGKSLQKELNDLKTKIGIYSEKIKVFHCKSQVFRTSKIVFKRKDIVATLVMGSRPRQRLIKVRAKNEPKNHISCSWECKREWRNEPPHSQVSPPLWELESQWTFESLKGNCKGQNTLDWKVLYTIEKILKHRCLKWACMTHLGF